MHCGDRIFDDYMSVFCGSIVTIGGIYAYCGYDVREDMQCRTWTEDMIEGLADDTQEKMVSLDKVCKWLRANIDLYADTRRSLFSNYQEVYLTDNFETEFRKAMGE